MTIKYLELDNGRTLINLIADEGKHLTDGTTESESVYFCADMNDSIENWKEVPGGLSEDDLSYYTSTT